MTHFLLQVIAEVDVHADPTAEKRVSRLVKSRSDVSRFSGFVPTT